MSTNAQASIIPPAPQNNCPFYGVSGMAFPLLLKSHGNQCGLLVRSHSPCIFEIDIDWRGCPRIQETTRDLVAIQQNDEYVE